MSGDPENTNGLSIILRQAADRVDVLVSERAQLREALAFYADPETYFAIGFFPDLPCGEFMDDFEELSGDLGHPDGGSWVKPGKRARAALSDGPGAEA